MKYILPLLLLTGCSPSLTNSHLAHSFFEGCKVTTLRMCKWNQSCIDKHMSYCYIESMTFYEVINGNN